MYSLYQNWVRFIFVLINVLNRFLSTKSTFEFVFLSCKFTKSWVKIFLLKLSGIQKNALHFDIRSSSLIIITNKKSNNTLLIIQEGTNDHLWVTHFEISLKNSDCRIRVLVQWYCNFTQPKHFWHLIWTKFFSVMQKIYFFSAI